MSFEVALLIFGILLSLVGLLGKVKAKELEIGTSNKIVRIALFLVGMLFIILSFNPKMFSFEEKNVRNNQNGTSLTEKPYIQDKLINDETRTKSSVADETNKVETDKLIKSKTNSDITIDRSDLTISKLAYPDRIKSLDGHNIVNLEDNKILFTGGFRAFLTLAHNNLGSHALIINGIQLNVNKFDSRHKAEYDYKIDSESIIGAGKVKPGVFSISLFGYKVGRAIKVKNGKSYTSRSENIYDTGDLEKIALKPSDYPEEVQITVLTFENGLYEVSFTVDYSIAGEDRKYVSDNILIYSWEN